MKHSANILEIKWKSAVILHQNNLFWNTAFQQGLWTFMNIQNWTSFMTRKKEWQEMQNPHEDFLPLTNSPSLGTASSDTISVLKVGDEYGPNNID